MKTKRYWLSGMIVATIVFVVICALFFSFDHSKGTIIDWLTIFPLLPFAFGSLFVGAGYVKGFVIQYLIYLIIGLLIGWTYGKIKKSRMVQ